MDPVKRPILFVTGTDTGVGKTALTAWLARCLSVTVPGVVALKPVCTGGRDDARALQEASGKRLSLDEINPWHFRAPLAPLLAARREQKELRLAQVLAWIRSLQKSHPGILVEGAGGLLTPIGEDFDARNLIVALRATPIVACANRLGAINQTLLVLAALPPALVLRARVVLMSLTRETAVARSNVVFLQERLGMDRVHAVPCSPCPSQPDRRVGVAIDGLARSLGW
jgi:dethiobiotin synthase